MDDEKCVSGNLTDQSIKRQTRRQKLIDSVEMVILTLSNQLLSTYKRFGKSQIPTVNKSDLFSGLQKLNADELQALNDLLFYSSISITEYKMGLNKKILEKNI